VLAPGASGAGAGWLGRLVRVLRVIPRALDAHHATDRARRRVLVHIPVHELPAADFLGDAVNVTPDGGVGELRPRRWGSPAAASPVVEHHGAGAIVRTFGCTSFSYVFTWRRCFKSQGTIVL
jgi:hypothetical protein